MCTCAIVNIRMGNVKLGKSAQKVLLQPFCCFIQMQKPTLLSFSQRSLSNINIITTHLRVCGWIGVCWHACVFFQCRQAVICALTFSPGTLHTLCVILSGWDLTDEIHYTQVTLQTTINDVLLMPLWFYFHLDLKRWTVFSNCMDYLDS